MTDDHTTTADDESEVPANYTDGQRRVLEVLEDGPATGPEIADALGVTASAVRGRIHRMGGVGRDDGLYHLEDHDADVGRVQAAYEDDGAEPPADTFDGDGDGEGEGDVGCPPPRRDRIGSDSKASRTRAANDALAEIEEESARLVEAAREGTSLPSNPRGKAGEVDLLVPRGDDHFGEVAEAYDYTAGEAYEVFNADIATEWVREATTQVLDLTTRLDDAYEWGTVHYALLGDSVTGEDIYPGQPHDIDIELREQIDIAAEVYFEQIARLAEDFRHVHVPTCPGNHGEIRSKSPSASNNADDFVYDRLEAMVRVSDLDNVSFTRSWRTSFVNFDIRGWRVHARHGQDSLSHIGTNSAKNRWRGWLDGNDFDIGLRQHYHSITREPVRGRPVLQSGSISPPDDFAESLAEWSPAGNTVHLIGDGQYPLEASYDLHFGPQ